MTAAARPEEPETARPLVRFADVSKTYDGQSFVVRGLDLTIAEGEFVTFLGPSGSGKTTSLMMLAGFERPSSGEIFLDGAAITGKPPHQRGLGVVFQNYALFPHMTVAENLAFPLRVRRVPGPEIAARVARALEMVHLDGLGARRPQQLSGGQQQRVAVARALIFAPRIVLMDEPLGALDKRLREQLQYEIRRIHQELGVTMLYVTHDQSEAMTLSDRIAVFNGGRIEQVADPRTLYGAPASLFVANFLGENNVIAGTAGELDGDRVTVLAAGGVRLAARAAGGIAAGAPVRLCVRPEALRLPAGEGDQRLTARVDGAVFLGDHLRVMLTGPDGGALVARQAPGTPREAAGATVTLGFAATEAIAFPAADDTASGDGGAA